MCGIAGWVSFDRDLRQDRNRSIVAGMAGTMSLRGPDEGGCWIDEHVGLGHRRLSVIDLEGGRQPMAADRDGRTVAVLSYSGEVYNFEELRSELAAKGHAFRTRSDTEVVLVAYLEWGDFLAEHLNGMFAFAIWDVRKEELLLVRDRLGVKPLAYMPLADGVVFGSEAKAIFAHPETTRRIGKEGLRALFLWVKEPGQGVFSDVSEVRPGQVVRVNRRGIAKRTYWRLTARPHPDPLRETVATVRHLLTDAVERQTVSDVPLCSLLSGGLDSSVVAALAHRFIRGNGGRGLRTFSVDFAGSGDVPFRADALGREALDGPFVRDFVRFAGIEHEEVVLESEQLLEDRLVTAVGRARDCPQGGSPDLYPSLWLLFERVRRSSTVALSGEAADEVFGGYGWMADPRAHGADCFPWLATGARAARDLSPILRREVREQLDVGTFEADAYRDAIAEVPRLPDEGPFEARKREISYLALTRFMPILLDRKDRLSMAHGLEVRVPFCDHRLVEYVYNAPWAMKTFDGREKSLLRAAFEDILPASVLERRKSPYPVTADPGYGRLLRERVGRIAADAGDPARELLDVGVLREMISEPVGESSSAVGRAALEAANGLSRWLRDTPVAIAL